MSSKKIKTFKQLQNQKSDILRFENVWIDFKTNLTYYINRSHKDHKYAVVFNKNGDILKNIEWE